ncbi:MAG: crossover junction endodeoxyribonuclease RuvC [Proteobacteria bacterium]|nr:crossover junction endodeoxyribonuclease RuvC [Pseudomonadota bacterium]
MSKGRRILGIDPGSNRTGYGIIEVLSPSRVLHVTHGHILVRGEEVNIKLFQIYQKIAEIIRDYQPEEAAIEQVFVNNNPQSALKLGQARGAALTAAGEYGLVLAEYSPRKIKQSVVGYGNAAKNQIQMMIKALLKMPAMPQEDAADALAVALCHGYHRTANISKEGTVCTSSSR